MSLIQEKKHVSRAGVLRRYLAVLFVLISASIAFAQNETTNPENEKLLDDYIKSKGYSGIIEFNATNIKQFWADPSVSSKNGSFYILLGKKNTEKMESVPLKIQLANVSEAMNCKVDVISNSSDIGFSITDTKSKVLSKSSSEKDFIHYHISSASFHMEDTSDYSFNLVFESGTPEPLSIKKIVLSFSINKNSSVLVSPGSLIITNNDLAVLKTGSISEGQDKSIVVSGKHTSICSLKFIPVRDNTISFSLKIKNHGDTPTRIYAGFMTYSKDKVLLDNRHYPYINKNTIMKVLLVDKAAGKIVVDSFPEWEKKCFLAWGAKQDLSDVPNEQIINGKISEVRQLENGQAEIIMSETIKTALEKGAEVRVHGTGSNLYTNIKTIQPGEEAVFSATIKKDNDSLEFSPKAFSKAVYFVKPTILSSDDFSIIHYTISF